MPRKSPPANTPSSQVEALADVAAGQPSAPPGVTLRPADLPFWAAILRARLPAAWAPNDLVHAAHLARTFADIEAMRLALASEGDLVTSKKSGATKANPRHALLDTLVRRSMSLTRLLQLHAVARVGQARDQGTRKAEALSANETLDELADDDLLAKPTH